MGEKAKIINKGMEEVPRTEETNRDGVGRNYLVEVEDDSVAWYLLNMERTKSVWILPCFCVIALFVVNVIGK